VVLSLEAKPQGSHKRGLQQFTEHVSLVFDYHLSLALEDERFIDEFHGMEVSFEFISGQIDQTETSGSEAANEPEIF
jgi:hypothetical protein